MPQKSFFRYIVLLIIGLLLMLVISASASLAQDLTTATPTVIPTSDFKPDVQHSILDYLVNNTFVPGTDKQASVYLLDLKTGQSFTVNPGLAYSAASVMKIAVMVALYRKISLPLTEKEAYVLADMIICSENTSSNAVIAFDGDGDYGRGLDFIASTVQALGLKSMILARLFYDQPGVPTLTPIPTEMLKTDVDQQSTNPDPLNQSTPDDVGKLLGAIYQCATDGTGLLTTTFPAEITMDECRAMMRVMGAVQINVMIAAGIPKNTFIAQKTGIGDEIHNDAAIILTPGGNYVLVIMMRNKKWLNYLQSFPAMAEISRMVYNSYNPGNAVKAIHPGDTPHCEVTRPLLDDLEATSLPPLPAPK